MKRSATRKLRTPRSRQREQERKFKPLAVEIGWIAYEWNRLQEALAELFSDAMEAKTLIAFNVWHSVRSDLAQREMLKAAATYREATAAPEAKPLWSAVLDLIHETDKISHKRNDALHVPLVFVNDLRADNIEIETLGFFGNPKARKLATKELIKEFNWYRNSAATLAQYAQILHFAFNASEHFPLPPKPVLPTLGQRVSLKRWPRQKKPKSSPPPPQQ